MVDIKNGRFHPTTKAGENMAEPTQNTPLKRAAKDKKLSKAAKDAIREADARALEAQKDTQPTEYGGPQGEEPTRYGDWERKGLTSDF